MLQTRLLLILSTLLIVATACAGLAAEPATESEAEQEPAKAAGADAAEQLAGCQS